MNYLIYLVEEIHTTVMATVDSNGLPVTRAIDIMDYDETGLYFLTAKDCKNPNIPARFIGTIAATIEEETADIHHYLDENKIEEKSLYDGLYVVCTDLLDMR